MKRLTQYLEWAGCSVRLVGFAALANGALVIADLFSGVVGLLVVHSALFAVCAARFCQLHVAGPSKAKSKIEPRPPGLPLTNTPNAVADGQCGICGMEDPITLSWEAESYGPCRLGDADVHRLCKEWFDRESSGRSMEAAVVVEAPATPMCAVPRNDGKCSCARCRDAVDALGHLDTFPCLGCGARLPLTYASSGAGYVCGDCKPHGKTSPHIFRERQHANAQEAVPATERARVQAHYRSQTALRCVECGSTDREGRLTFDPVPEMYYCQDHIQPRDRGGADISLNLQRARQVADAERVERFLVEVGYRKQAVRRACTDCKGSGWVVRGAACAVRDCPVCSGTGYR